MQATEGAQHEMSSISQRHQMLNNREQLILSPWAWSFGGRVEVVEDVHRDAQTEWHSARLLDMLSTVNQRVKQPEVKKKKI